MSMDIEIRKALIENAIAKMGGIDTAEITIVNENVFTVSFAGRNTEAEEKLVSMFSGVSTVADHLYEETTNETYIWVKIK